MMETIDERPAYLGRDKRGAIVLVSALNDDGSIDNDTMLSMARLTTQGGTVILTTVGGVKAALDRDGYGKPTDQPYQPKLF